MQSESPTSLLGRTLGSESQPTADLPELLPRFLTVAEASVLLRVSKRTVYDWVSRGRIPFRKAGRITLFDRDEIVEWTKRAPA